MRFLVLIIALALLAVPRLAAGQDGRLPESKGLQLRPKSLLESSSVPVERAPFLVSLGEPALDLSLRPEDARLKDSRSSCEQEGRSLCYDSGSGKIVYKKTREYMPALPGMRAEHISLRRDRITFKYSFQ